MLTYVYSIALSFVLVGCNSAKNKEIDKTSTEKAEMQRSDQSDKATAVFASGCFWCVEAVFESVEGVSEAVSGYAGGSKKNANYSDVSAGITDHAESVEVYYDPEVVSYETLLKVFFGSHDPTTLNRQGPDRGRQYRSTIFYKNEDELNAAKAYIAQLENDKVFDGEITTTLEKLDKFYPAEDYHQDYERKNPDNSYVRNVSVPRLNKFKKKYPELLKSSAKLH